MRIVTVKVGDDWEEGDSLDGYVGRDIVEVVDCVSHDDPAPQPYRQRSGGFKEIFRTNAKKVRKGQSMNINAPAGFSFTAAHTGVYCLVVLADGDLNMAMQVIEEK